MKISDKGNNFTMYLKHIQKLTDEGKTTKQISQSSVPEVKFCLDNCKAYTYLSFKVD